MLNADDPESILSARRLATIVASRGKPIVFWIGAGASKWLGYPSWRDLALDLRRKCFLSAVGFDNPRALRLIDKEDYPELFGMCHDIDPQLYRKTIADVFVPLPRTSVHKAFTEILAQIQPLYILTTNIDEALESTLSMCAVVQRSDLTRCVDLLQRKIPFIAKLHGSVSAIATAVFTTADYRSILAEGPYLQTLKSIFASCTVVFLGYGIRDAYVVKLLSENATEMEVFGAGPHFAVTNQDVPVKSVHKIRYVLRIRPDHSAALSVLDLIKQASSEASSVTVEGAPQASSESEAATQKEGVVPANRTAYYISDLLPIQLFQEIKAQQRESGQEMEASFGLGFAPEELPFAPPTGLHDIAVGLICFDYLYLPFDALGHAAILLGEGLLRHLLNEDIVRFVYTIARVGVIFRPGDAMGSLANVTGRGSDGLEPVPVRTMIRRALSPQAGKEQLADELFELIERRTIRYRRSDEINLPSLVRGALIMPAVSRLLGVGDAILPSVVPRWLRFPYLRLAHLVQTAVISSEYKIQAAKVCYGGVQLTSAAFGVQPAETLADHLASYACSGFYNSDLGNFLYQNPSLIAVILSFRGTSEGERFRRETGQVLASDSGREFNASVNAGLNRSIPEDILRKAHDKMLMLMTESAKIAPVPAVWGSVLRSDSITAKWRARGRTILVELCKKAGIGKDDHCICGSGEKLRLCCLAPLR